MKNYLGCLLTLSNGDSKYVKFIVDKVRTKLAGWRIKLLSMVGRTPMINFVMDTILLLTSCNILPRRLLPAKCLIN